MIYYKAELYAPLGLALGEGPVYDRDTNTLSFIDILSGTLYLQRDGFTQQVRLGQYVGAALPAVGGGYAVALTTGLYLADEGGLRGKIGAPDGFSLRQRFNDAKCDGRGRLWAGSLSLYGDETCALYRVERGSIGQVLAGQGLPNGMDWDADLGLYYFIDTPTGRVDAFDFDLESGQIANRRMAVRIERGQPDGMAIDREGMLWVAQWGGGCVGRYDPRTGAQTAQIDIPATNVTSCCFGGPHLSTLYITTARAQGEPLSGHLFAARTDTQGLPPNRYLP